jgi:hypothetical protein
MVDGPRHVVRGRGTALICAERSGSLEATLTASAIVVGNPAEIAVVRVNFTL